MPAQRHTKKADTAKKQRQWEHVRESELKSGKSKGAADRIANGVIKKESSGRGNRSVKRSSVAKVSKKK